MLALLAVIGCSFPLPDCADGYARDGDESCQPVPHSGIDDSGEPSNLSGEYTGEIALAVLAETGGLVIEDDCVGPVAFDRFGPELSGTVECQFQGSVDGLVGGKEFAGTIDGEIDGEGATVGRIVLDLDIFGVLDEQWSGVTGPEAVNGTVIGEMSFEVGGLVVPVQFDGVFDAVQ